MGLMKKPSSGNYNPTAVIAPPNPDPKQFRVEHYEKIGNGLVVLVVYPNCTTYEGRKVLVFASTSITTVKSCKMLDPHFSDRLDPPAGTPIPVARFEPTDRGWRLARIVAAAL
jgi:hypothetical protein